MSSIFSSNKYGHQSIWLGGLLSLSFNSIAQQNHISAVPSLESVTEILTPMMSVVLITLVIVFLINMAVKIIKLTSMDYQAQGNKSVKNNNQVALKEKQELPSPTVITTSNIDSKKSWDWRNKANEALSPMLNQVAEDKGYWIKDEEIKSLWLTFEEKLSVVQTHKNYNKEYALYRNIEALKSNVLAVLEPYVANTVNSDNNDFYVDIRVGLIKTLNTSNDYLTSSLEDLMNITRKSMKVDLLYLEQKLK